MIFLQITSQHQELQDSHNETHSKLQEVEEFSAKIEEEMQKLESIETDENKRYLKYFFNCIFQFHFVCLGVLKAQSELQNIQCIVGNSVTF